jgi:hypothetical protein
MFGQGLSTNVFPRTQAKISETNPALPCIKESALRNMGLSRFLSNKPFSSDPALMTPSPLEAICDER